MLLQPCMSLNSDSRMMVCCVQVREFDTFTKSMGTKFTVSGKNLLCTALARRYDINAALAFVQPFEAARSVGTIQMRGR